MVWLLRMAMGAKQASKPVCKCWVQVFDEPGIASSPLALPGAAERCVELFSFAKSHQMGGFRLGFALGNAQALASLEAVKVSLQYTVRTCNQVGVTSVM
jgi:aspartate/methionine/tyrosine aminotransferase